MPNLLTESESEYQEYIRAGEASQIPSSENAASGWRRAQDVH